MSFNNWFNKTIEEFTVVGLSNAPGESVSPLSTQKTKTSCAWLTQQSLKSQGQAWWPSAQLKLLWHPSSLPLTRMHNGLAIKAVSLSSLLQTFWKIQLTFVSGVRNHHSIIRWWSVATAVIACESQVAGRTARCRQWTSWVNWCVFLLPPPNPTVPSTPRDESTSWRGSTALRQVDVHNLKRKQ